MFHMCCLVMSKTYRNVVTHKVTGNSSVRGSSMVKTMPCEVGSHTSGAGGSLISHLQRQGDGH